MKRIAAVLLAMLLAAMPLAAMAAVEDGFGYVEKFTLEDGTELPVKVEHKTNWIYDTFQAQGLEAEDIPVYTVTVPEGNESICLYLTETGREAFGHAAALYSYVYNADGDALDTEAYAANIDDRGDYYSVPVQTDYGYAWELSDWSVGAILLINIGDLPAPAQRVSGDVNGDQAVTVDDAILVLQHVAALNTLGDDALKAADVTGDGNVDVNDAIAILNKVAGAN